MLHREYVAITILVAFLSGCSQQMPLRKGVTAADVQGKTIALFTVRIANHVNADCQFDILGFWLQEQYAYSTDAADRVKDKSYKEYLLSCTPTVTEQSEATMSLSVQHYVPLLLAGAAVIPLRVQTKFKPNTTVYLGHIDIVLRPKKDNEDCAQLLPLIDAAIIGLSRGAFDVTAEDHYEEDVKAYRSKYPALEGVKIEKSDSFPCVSAGKK